MILTGCGGEEEPVAPEPADPEEVINIGVALSSPGLASGSSPEGASGAEISLAQALVEELDTVEPGTQVRWRALGSIEHSMVAVEEGELEFVIGQLTDQQLSDQLGWVGPYITATPAVLVRVPASDAAEPEVLPFKAITSIDELTEASVCVVADSVSASADLPVEHSTVQQTVTECEVGMRSGRFDAIAADDVQLAGVLLDPGLDSTYQVLSWSELADDDQDLSEQLTESHRYWIATDPAQCEAVSEALQAVLEQGVLVEAFSAWQETTDFEPELFQAADVETRHCDV